MRMVVGVAHLQWVVSCQCNYEAALEESGERVGSVRDEETRVRDRRNRDANLGKGVG